ncbi:general substrate transporter [Patellaria atrata CBS 101060]|uniref:General substrate transporter n=1 Tax=Patellaria atrata CBS 101060 TaxID=1346257 RepID=A0A9P4SDY6_9PEZI|nr:general substrate transporter [Patellaria atrata CBS 101060]
MKTASNVYVVCSFAAIGGALFGMDIASMSAVLGTSAYKHYFNYPKSYMQGLITSSMPMGSIFGTFSSSFIADRYSRKIAIQIACVLWIMGSAIQSGCNGLPALCLGRAVAGVGIGIASAVVPMYQAEIAPKEIRGRVVTIQQWGITWGILIQYFIQYGASFAGGGADNPTQGTIAFRLPWAIQIVPGLILGISLFWLPYSPRWLASQDRWEESVTVLANLHARGDVKHPKVLAQYREIEEALRFEKEVAAAGWAALLEARMAKRVLLGMSVQFWSQLSGVNIMMYYIVYIMEGTNIGSPLLTASVQYIINVVMTVPALLWLDRWGRRATLLLGAFSMSVFLFISGALQGAFGEPITDPDSDLTWHIVNNPPVSKVVVACSYMVVATFATSWGPVSWIYPSEIFPNKIRAKAVSLSTATNWIANCVLAFAVPPLLYNINWKMYMVFGTFNALALIQVFLTLPETKNISLEEMDMVFTGYPWKSRQKRSQLDDLEEQIAGGAIEIKTLAGLEQDQKPIMVETVIEMRNERRSSRSRSSSEDPYYTQGASRAQ